MARRTKVTHGGSFLKKEFRVIGLELLEKKVVHYDNASSRVIVPVSWDKVALIRLK